MLPAELRRAARFVGDDTCWPLEWAADAVEKLAEADQIILGVEAWQLRPEEQPLVYEFSTYKAEDYAESLEGLVRACKDRALEFISRIPPEPHMYIEVLWVDWTELHSLRGKARGGS
jgi:hypothetical protein